MTQPNNAVSRRQFLERMVALTGGALSAPLVSAVLAGASAHAADPNHKLLTDKQMRLVTAIVDTIIPETDTPGASAAGVQHFIHMMLADWYKPKERKPVLEGLKAIDDRSLAKAGKGFADVSEAERLEILGAFDEAAYGENGGDHFFRRLKQMTVVGYYTSEIGASEELRYEPVPGPYRGCVPFSEIGRTWAL